MWTVLHWAVEADRAKIVKLLEYGAFSRKLCSNRFPMPCSVTRYIAITRSSLSSVFHPYAK
jgi:hypothetical protein